nr:hypothetical protein [Candidatus Anoxychlamydiales bacterium]
MKEPQKEKVKVKVEKQPSCKIELHVEVGPNIVN